MGTGRAADTPPNRPVTGHSEGAGPTVARRLVGAELRRLREAAGITREDAGHAIRSSDSKISRLELGRTRFKARDLADLLTLYGLTEDAERQIVIAMAAKANAPGWWQSYGDVVPGWFEHFLGLEQAASVIRSYEVQFIPGLLQTADYAAAVIRISHQDDPQVRLEQRVDLRMRRQQHLTRPDPPKLWVVIDEAALRRPIGSRAMMRAQLTHLAEMAELPHITIQVMPFSAGGHPAAGGSVTFLRFPEGEVPDVVYLEQLDSAVYLEKPAETERYWDVLNKLSVHSDRAAETPAILRRILKAT
jgi:transcriptional regulator with XRE-family HTH domain